MAKKFSENELKRLTTEHAEFLVEFGQEGDRACAILGVAKLDSLLFQILTRALRTNPSKSDGLLEGNGPLSTFSSRIDMAHRLGILGADLTRALHLLRRIRNDFAHEAAGATLSAGSHRDRVMELARSFSAYRDYDIRRASFESHPDGAPQDFRAVLSILVARLTGIFHRVDCLDMSGEASLVPPNWTRRSDAEHE